MKRALELKCRLLRNCPLDDLTGLGVDQREAEIRGPLPKTTNMHAMVGIIRVCPWVTIDEPVLQRAIHENASLRAVAVTALALPARTASRR